MIPVVLGFGGRVPTSDELTGWQAMNREAVRWFQRVVGVAPVLEAPRALTTAEVPLGPSAWPPTQPQALRIAQAAYGAAVGPFCILGLGVGPSGAGEPAGCLLGEPHADAWWEAPQSPRTQLWLLLHEQGHVAGLPHPYGVWGRADTIMGYASTVPFEQGLDVGFTDGELALIRANPLWKEHRVSVIQAPAHPNNYGGYGIPNVPRALVFHTPEEMPDDYEATPEWFQNPNAGASTHAYADNDGDLYVILDDAEAAWACGTRENVNRHWYGQRNVRPPWTEPGISNNCRSLSIEIEGRAADLAMPEVQYQTVLRWSYEKITKWQIPIDRDHLVGHGDLAEDRTDPGPHFPWGRLLADLRAMVAAAAAPVPVPPGAGITWLPLDSAQSLAALESAARSFGAASVDNSLTVVEVTGGLPLDLARYIPAGGHAWLFTTKD